MSGERAIVHRFSVGGWTCELSMPVVAQGEVRHAHCEWTPSVPRRAFTPAEEAQYRAGLAEAMRLSGTARPMPGGGS